MNKMEIIILIHNNIRRQYSMKYDVVIVGAGPAGMAAAHTLINNNISCCVIDKQVFPRNKLCAGGLTNKVIGLLDELKLGKEFNGKNTVYRRYLFQILI